MNVFVGGIGLCCACIGTIALKTIAGCDTLTAAIAAAAAACAALAALRMRGWTVMVGAMIGACAAIAALHLERWPASSPILPAGHEIRATGIVLEPSVPRGWYRRYTLGISHLMIDGTPMPWTGEMVLHERSLQPAVAQGETVVVTVEPLPAMCVLGASGDPASADGEIVSHAKGTGLRSWLGAARQSVERRIQGLLPEPHAGLLTGLLTGGQRRLPDATRQDFSRTGLSHITAVSGSNITLLLLLLQHLFWWMPRGVRLALSICGVVCFSVFVGGSASVVRAAIMGCIGVLALHGGRMVHARAAMLWTLTVMLCFDPSALRDDLGLQLSFLATIGLVESGPWVKPLSKRLPEAFGIREAVHATIAAQLWAAPLSAKVFGILPLVGTLANVLVAPLVPMAMLLGAASLPASALHITLGRAIAYAAWVPLEGILRSASALASAPAATIAWTPHATTLCAWYACLAAAALWRGVTSGRAAPSCEASG